jgi:hypothetical protein
VVGDQPWNVPKKKKLQLPTVIPKRGPDGVTLRTPAVLMGTGALTVLLLAAFGLGWCSAPAQSDMAGALRAKAGWATAPQFERPAEPPVSRGCLMLRAPSRWSPDAARQITFEMLATPDGRLAVGYARSMQHPAAFAIDLATGDTEIPFELDEGEDELSRVVPFVRDGEVKIGITKATDGDVSGAVFVPSTAPFVLGFTNSQLVALDEPGGESAPLWELATSEKRPDALRTAVVADKGIAVTYRHDGQNYFGWLDPERNPVRAATPVAGSGGKVGKPVVASNGADVSLVFADKPPGDDTDPEIRWAHAPVGQPLGDAAVVEIPEGGPGGPAIAPSVAALSGERWLLMWTEGSPGARVLRAQTYDRSYQPVGTALRVSPATGSFGQGTVGVVGERASIVFLLASGKGYEIWGTVLECQ